MSPESHWEAVNVLVPESNGIDDESGQLDAPLVCWRPLYAYSALIQSPPCHSSSIYPVLTERRVLFVFSDIFLSNFDTFLPQHHRDYGGVIGTAGRATTLRRVKGNIRSVKRGHKTTISLSLSQPKPNHVVESCTRSPPPKFGPKQLTPILEQEDSPEMDPGILSQSDSIDSGLGNSADSAIHFVDEASGATFSRVQHASGACVSAEEFVLERSSLDSSLSLHIGSPLACAAADLDAHIESVPSLVLTIPTPASPHSPIFSRGVHFTTEKFLDAAGAAATRDRAPTLPQCDHGQEGKLCRACELQLLACRVWFQNADGGARAALHEPFVRPAQSTMRTRAVLASLGVGVQCPPGVGLGLADVQDEGKGETLRDEDDEDDIDDPGLLAIEAPRAARPRPVSLDRAISWSRVVLRKLGLRLQRLSLSMSFTRASNKHRKHYHS